MIHIDTVVKKGGREVDRPALLSVWPILKQLIEAVRRAVNNANMLNTCVKGDAHANAIRELKQLHTSEIQKLTTELTSMNNKISDVSGKLEEGIRGVEELRGVVAGHTDTLVTKTSTTASQADHAAMKALAERVEALERPWYSRRGNTRIHPGADASILLRRMNEFNSCVY